MSNILGHCALKSHDANGRFTHFSCQLPVPTERYRLLGIVPSIVSAIPLYHAQDPYRQASDATWSMSEYPNRCCVTAGCMLLPMHVD